jgi:hypothetical protein
VEPKAEVDEAKGLVGDEEEKGLAHGSELGSDVVHVGLWIVDWDKRFAKSASSSIV